MSKDDKERKALAKLNETPEEKQQRRLEKKAKKDAKRKRENEEGRDLMGYTNESNPFGDSNLTEKFVWKLKNEKDDKTGGRDPKADAERERERRREIEKVKAKRDQREQEKAQWEEEKTRLQREQDAQSYQDWEAKEDEFYLKQAKMAADIRIKQGRAKPIDILYKNLSMDNDADFEMDEPYKIFTGLGLQQLEELKKDIRVFLELDSHKDFWSALDIVCEDELDVAKKRDAIEKSKSKAEMMRYASNTGMHEAINSDVHDIFKGKSSKELETLQASITQQIESGVGDTEYWDTLLKKLVIFKAKAKLKEIHAEVLRRKLAELESKAGSASTSSEKPKEVVKTEPATIKNEEDEKPAKKQAVDEYSRPMYAYDDVEEDTTTISAQKRKLQNEAKKYGLNINDKTRERILSEEEMYKQEAAIAMEEEEEELLGDVELPVENKVYSKDDKFRPRKPRFFNRVHTGYEWNKYNQTHYDHDNPPPKIVQGYKFNIFYPDLLSKSTTPTFKIVPGADSDTCTLVIHAGPPYEDIAFKIVNREWEYSHKKGYKCTFERGILHLWINFKKYRYRR